MLGSGAQMLRVDWETARALSDADAARLVKGVQKRVARAGAVVLSDYGKGVLCGPVLRAVIDAARAAGVPVLVDPKGTDYARYRGATLLTPNRKEAEEALNRKLPGLSDMPRAVRDRAYAVVVRNRYRWFGRYDQCPLPAPEHRAKFIVD